MPKEGIYHMKAFAFFFEMPKNRAYSFPVLSLLGYCKINSDLWTLFLFNTQRIAFGTLCMIGEVIFDKTDH